MVFTASLMAILLVQLRMLSTWRSLISLGLSRYHGSSLHVTMVTEVSINNYGQDLKMMELKCDQAPPNHPKVPGIDFIVEV